MDVYKKEKPSIRNLANRFGIGKTQAANIIKNSEKLTNKWYSNSNFNEKCSFLKKS